MKHAFTTALVLHIIFAAAILAAPAATAQEDPDFTGIRTLIRDQQLAEAEAELRATLGDPDLQPGPRAEARDLLVETLLRAPYPDFETVVPLARETVSYREENLGPDDPRLSISYRHLGVALDRSGERQEAVTWFEKAAGFIERQEGPDSIALCAALNSVGVSYMGMSDYARAAEVFTRIIDLYDAADDKGDANVSIYLINRAKCYRVLGNFDAAEADYRRGVSEAEEGPDVGPAELADRLLKLAEFLLENNRALAAIEPSQRALTLSREAHPEIHPQVAGAERMLGWALRRAARFEESRLHLERAVGIAEQLAEQDPDLLMKSLESLAELERDLGNTDMAIALQERTIEIAVETFGPDHDSVSVAYSKFAEFLARAGRFAESREYFERCREIDTKTFGPTHPFVGNDILNAAAVSFYAGDYDTAERGFQEVEVIWGAAFPEDHPQMAILHYNYAVLLANRGQLEESRRRFEIAAPSLAGALGPQSPDLAEILNDYGKVLFESGRFEDARDQLERALVIRRAAFGDAHPAIVLSLGALANLDAAVGNLDLAAARADSARAIAEATLGADHPWTGRATQDLATVLVLQGEYADALDLAVRAENTGRDHLRLLARGSSERQTLAYAASRATGLDLGTTAAIGLGDRASAHRAWDSLVRSRALVLDEMAARNRALVSASSDEDRALVEELQTVRARLARLVVRGPGELDPRTHEALVAEATRQKEALEREFAQNDASAQARQRDTQVGWAEVRAALADDQALIAYQRFAPPNEPARYAAFLARGDSDLPVLIDLGPSEQIEVRVAAWRAAVIDPGAPTPALSVAEEAAYRIAGTRLRETIWDPLAAHLGDAAEVFVVADGAINLVSLAALPIEDGYLIDSARVLHLLSTERDLVRFSRTAGPSSADAPQLLAVGGVDFDATGLAQVAMDAERSVYRGTRSSCGEFGDLMFDPLPQSGPEAERVASAWGESATDLLLGAQAGESQFKSLAHGANAIHAATHGFFLTGACPDPSGSGALRVEFAQATSQRVPENPLLQSGLAMAGANQRANRSLDAEDGILTAEEIAALDLRNADWVVLSACDTGLGHVAAGEGVLGLRRAFEIAGARSLITSLWPVDDNATAAWMGHLYSNRLGEGLGAAAAAHAAARALLEERRSQGLSTHPFYWAPFVASGDWR